jgi:hypothetical protein
VGSIHAQVTYTNSVIATHDSDEELRAITVDGAGNVYYYGISTRTIRKVAADGQATTLSGQGGTVISGLNPPDIGAGTVAAEVALQMNASNINLVSDVDGNLSFHQDGLLLELRASDAQIYRIAGKGAFGTGFTELLPGIDFNFAGLGNMVLDSEGQIFFGNSAVPFDPHVLRLNTDGTITKIAGGNGRGTDGDGGLAVDAMLNGGYDGMAIDPLGNIFLADDRTLRRIGTDGIITLIHDGGDGVADGPFAGEDISTVAVGAFNSVSGGQMARSSLGQTNTFTS